MARIRTVKPDLFRHEELFEAEQEEKLPIRVAFIALFTVCDREGRFKWRPRSLKLDCLPYDDVDFSRVLEALNTRGFIEKYIVDGVEYGVIPSFTEHQVINNRESASNLPEPTPGNIEKTKKDNDLNNDSSRVGHASTTRHDSIQGEGKGREGNGRERNTVCTEQSPVVFKLPLNAKETFHEVTAKHLSEFAELYPAVDIEQQFRNMIGWLNANTQRRKTKNGINRFVNSWLSREQDKGGKSESADPSGRITRKPSFAAKNSFIEGDFERVAQ